MTALQEMKAFNDEGLSVVIRWNSNFREFTIKRRWNRRASSTDCYSDEIGDAIATARDIDARNQIWASKTGGWL